MEKLLDKNQREFKPGQLVRYYNEYNQSGNVGRLDDKLNLLRDIGDLYNPEKTPISDCIDYANILLPKYGVKNNLDYLPEIICEKFIVYIQSPVDAFYGLINLNKKESKSKDLLKNHLLKFDKDNWLLTEQVMYNPEDKTYKLTGNMVYIEKTSMVINKILEIF